MTFDFLSSLVNCFSFFFSFLFWIFFSLLAILSSFGFSSFAKVTETPFSSRNFLENQYNEFASCKSKKFSSHLVRNHIRVAFHRNAKNARLFFVLLQTFSSSKSVIRSNKSKMEQICKIVCQVSRI